MVSGGPRLGGDGLHGCQKSRSVLGTPLFEELAGAVLLFGWRDQFGVGGEGADGGVGGDLLDGGVVLGWFEALLGWQVEAGDLEAIEQETGAARVELVLGELLQDHADAVLDGAAVFHERERQGGGAATAAADVFGWAAGGVVVVAEVFVAVRFAQAGRAAAASVGEDVAALEAFGLFGHGGFSGLLVLGYQCQ